MDGFLDPSTFVDRNFIVYGLTDVSANVVNDVVVLEAIHILFSFFHKERWYNFPRYVIEDSVDDSIIHPIILRAFAKIFVTIVMV